MHQSGRHFLQIPGPTNVPDRVLRAMAQPTIDHRSAAFAEMTREVIEGLKQVFQTRGHVIIFPGSGTGAWEAALVNTLSPGDRVLAFETGTFALWWAQVAQRFGLTVEIVPGDWRSGVDPATVEAKLKEDRAQEIKALLVVHNETSTGVTTRVGDVRRAMDRASHPALLLVDAVSSLASIDLKFDEWGVDVALAGSQKGLMLPPGLGFHAVSDKAIAASRQAKLPRSYWSWDPMFEANKSGFFPYTPSTNLLYGLREALRILLREEGLAEVFARHRRLAAAARCAARAWGLEIACIRDDEFSSVVTTVMTPEGHNAEQVRKVAAERLNLSLGAGLGKLSGKAFRIGHLGDFNELMLAGTLCGVEMALELAEVPFNKGGVAAAMAALVSVISRGSAASASPETTPPLL